MKSKLTAITILSLVIASLLVAGCTTSTTSNTNQTPSATPSIATHDAFLEKYLTEYKNRTYTNENLSMKAFEVTWINSTSASLQKTYFNKSQNLTWSNAETLIVFPTTQDATNYLKAVNKTAYSLVNTSYPVEGTYQNVTGHTPEIYREYVWREGVPLEGAPLNISEYKHHTIFQLDNLVRIVTAKLLPN